MVKENTQELLLKAVTEEIQKNGLSVDDDVCRISLPQNLFDENICSPHNDDFRDRVTGGKFERSCYVQHALLGSFLKNILGYCVLNLNKNTRKYFPALK